MDKAEMLKENRDELTGLLDKQAFYVWSQELIDTSEDDDKYAFIFFDVDNFKLFNANYGFEKGDELLVSIAGIIKEIFKDQLVARFSGDHFVVCTNTIQLIPAITEIRKRVKQLQKNINLELKAGVYVLDGETTDVVRCSDRARMACVSIKKKYDIDYRFYDEALGGSLTRKQFIIDNLDEALENKYIQVYYQPIVRAMTENVCGWEALVRWIDPVRGVVYPNEFIPVLEEYRLIHKIDSYVMERVFSKISKIKSNNCDEAVPISINLSRIDFEALDIIPYIDKLVEKHGVSKKMFNFEITESVLMDSPRFIQEQIIRLRTKGYSVWMDDFGSGYSSLNVLKNFDFDLVKIDMEFLRGFESSDNGKIIIKHMVSMLKNLGFHTLAEGVETKEQMDFLKDVGCELIQGYLIGRPLPFNESVESLKKSGYKYENRIESDLYDKVGSFDILKQNPLEVVDEEIGSSLPLAIGVVRDGVWKFIYANDGYLQEIKIYGNENIIIVEDMINYPEWRWFRRDMFWEICAASKASHETESMEFVDNGRIINMRVRHIVWDEATDSDAYMVSIRSLSKHVMESYEKKSSIISNYLLGFYECIDLYGLDNNYFENIYLANSGVHVKHAKLRPTEIIEKMAENRVHEDDRRIFLEFMDLNTIRERLASEENGLKLSFFRILNSKNIYVWKCVIIRIIEYLDREVMLVCVGEATRELSQNMDAFVTGGHADMFKAVGFTGHTPEEYAFENIIRLVPAGVFWKDKNRRFIGANQMFLDYYGLKSVESIKGKTDEDMGWHINPDPFMEDELSVINEGKIIKNVHGECIVKGRVRKISATKQPFIVDGEIVGLIGFFNDITEQEEERRQLENLSNTDELTGLLNRRAFDKIAEKYVSQYNIDKTDFVLILLDIDRFKQINDMFGHDFGDEVLKRTSEIIRGITSNNSVAFRIGGDEFAILHQFKSDAEIRSIIQELVISFANIDRIARMDIKVRASVGTAMYSKANDLHELLKMADKEMYEDKEQHKK